jgi:hypothetical protein
MQVIDFPVFRRHFIVAGCGATCLCSDQAIPFVTHATKRSPISHRGAVYLFQQEILSQYK